MKTLNLKTVLIMVGIALSIGVFAQKPKERKQFEKINLKTIESNRNGLDKLDKESNIVRAKYNENYFSKNLKQPDSIAYEYLKQRYASFGISKDLKEIKIKKVSITPGGKYIYYEQYLNDIPVYSSIGLIALNKGDSITYVLNNVRNTAKYNKVVSSPAISTLEAIDLAKNYLNIKGKIVRNIKNELIYFESNDIGLELAWKINIVSMNPLGDWLVVVNSTNKRIIHVEDKAMYDNGSGMIYNPDPITTAQTTYGGNFVDNSDNNNTSLSNQRIQVTLRDITFQNNTYKLEGPYCVLDDVETPTDNFPNITNQNGFNYTRDQQEFEAVMLYYHVDMASRRVESVGYNVTELRTFSADPHGLDGDDNSHYVPSQNYVSFGEGGVDDAEDATIIWHEYAHAIQENLGAGNMSYSGETMSVQEGSSDYWSISYKRSISTYNWGFFANWDGHNPFWDGRRADLNWVYPTDYVYGHEGGQIWSSALMKIWADLGRDITDRLFLETHFLWGQSPSMEDAAEAFIQADIQLYGGSHLCTIIQHFRTHGLTSRELTVYVNNRTITADETISGCDVDVSNVTIQNNSKVKINAANNVNINGSFEVKVGSELEIK